MTSRVLYGAAGLDYCLDPGLFGHLDVVLFREKKASLARHDPLASLPAFLTAIMTDSTRDIWPAPTPTVTVPFVRTIAFDFYMLGYLPSKEQ